MLRTCLRIMCKKYALKFILYSKYYNEKILEKWRNKNIFAIFYSKQWFLIRCKKLKADHSQDTQRQLVNRTWNLMYEQFTSRRLSKERVLNSCLKTLHCLIFQELSCYSILNRKFRDISHVYLRRSLIPQSNLHRNSVRIKTLLRMEYSN